MVSYDRNEVHSNEIVAMNYHSTTYDGKNCVLTNSNNINNNKNNYNFNNNKWLTINRDQLCVNVYREQE